MRAGSIRAIATVATALLLVGGCGGGSSSSGGTAQGGVGQSCYPNGTCNTGLSCYSNLCVDANVDGGSDGGGTNDSSVGSDTGSGGDSATTPGDSAPGDSGNGAGDTGPETGPAGCTTYASSSIAAMRQGHASGCFRLDSVAALGVTPGPDYRLFVQDPAGGSYSAMRTTCSASNSADPCTVGATVGALAGLQTHTVTLEGSYVYTASSMAEDFYIDTATNVVVGNLPAPFNAGDVGGLNPSLFTLDVAYQRLTVQAEAGNQLVTVDWSPSQFSVTSASACPYQVGFAVAPQSAGIPQGMACTNNTSQPPPQSSPSSMEILIGTDFSTTFTIGTDCRCSSSVPTAGSRATSVAGILVWNVPASGPGYMYVAPQSNSDMPGL